MGKFLLFLGLFVSKIAFSQLNDDFSDGDFTKNPVWQGDVTAYTINSNKQLQTVSSAISQKVNLYTPNHLAMNAKWDFFIDLGFDPSSSNQTRIYLIADQANFNGPLNGYFLLIGESDSTDSYDLYRQNGVTTTKIIDGPAKTRLDVNELKARIQITRDANGLWELKTDPTGSTNYTSEGTVTDRTFTETSFFGVKSIYTSTRSALFIYDEFSISELVADSTPPILTAANTIDGKDVILNFNEAIDPTDAKIADHYFLSPGDIHPSAIVANGSEVTLYFSNQMNTGDYTITVIGIKDLKGNNSSAQNKSFHYKKPYFAKPNDIVINEIFADPSPQVDLPSVEFVELYNRTSEDISMKNFNYTDGTSTYKFSNDSLHASEFLILCAKADTTEYKRYGKFLGISPWPSLNNSGDQITLSDQNGVIISSVAYTDAWYGDLLKKPGGWTLERIDPFSNCSGASIWTASTSVSGGTPGSQNAVYIQNYDGLAFKTENFSVKNDSTLFIQFNKSLDAGTLTFSSSSFDLSPNIKLKSIATDISQKNITLNYDKFQPGRAYILSLSNLMDCGGGSLIGEKSFSFKTPAIRPDTAHLLITEIFADPSPEVGLPLAEFLELYNAGEDPLDLKDYTISDPTTKARINAGNIAPHEYAILCSLSDTLQYQKYGKVIGVSPWPSLNNDKDHIVLKSHTGRLIDSVDYSDNWYKDPIKKLGGWSLERIDLKALNCNNFYNWAAARHVEGGTPGKVNSIAETFSSSNDLLIDDIAVLNDSTIKVHLNFYPDTLSLKNAKFPTTLLGNPKKILFDGISYRNFSLIYAQNLKEATTYQISPSGIMSCNGLNLYQTISFTTPFTAPINYPVVINEILADPSPVVGLPEIEFLELKNLSDTAVSLKHMVYENDKSRVVFDKGLIAPNGFLIVCAAKDTLTYQLYGNTVGLKSFPSLNNDKSQLILKNNKGVEFNRVAYDISWYGDKEKQKGGYTLELIDPLSLCGGKQNWTASKDERGGTPGKENSVYLQNHINTPLMLLKASISDSLTLLIDFDRSLDSLQTTLVNQYNLNNSVGNPVSSNAVGPIFNQVKLNFDRPLSRNMYYTLQVNGLTDCSGHQMTAQSISFTYPGLISKNDVLISEILFNPKPGGVDFVELYNNSEKHLDFKDLKIAAVNDKDSLIAIKPLNQQNSLFEPQTYWVVSTNPDTVKAQYFTSHPNNFIKLSGFPSYNDDKGKAVVLNKDNVRIDQLNYDKNMHFALLKDFNGVSLERTSFNQPANAPGNFRSAAAAVGYATPGDKNSQFLEDINMEEEVSLASVTFSPDNDGFEDVLRVLYKLNQPNYAANVTIYDDQGRIIKKLIRNQTLATSGQWIWDGLDESNNKVKTGIYIIYAELFDLNGNIRKYKKTAVAASKFD